MGFLGTVPGSLFTLSPTQVTITDEWRTLFSEFETGAEQRRSKWARPRLNVRFIFQRARLTADEANDVWRFWKAMEGPHKAFDLPLFGRLTTVDSEYSGGFSLGVADTQDMTTEITSRWSKLYVEDPAAAFANFQIVTVVGTHEVTVASASTVTFPVGSPVSPIIRARFADSQMSFDYLVVLMTTVGLQFTEVRS